MEEAEHKKYVLQKLEEHEHIMGEIIHRTAYILGHLLNRDHSLDKHLQVMIDMLRTLQSNIYGMEHKFVKIMHDHEGIKVLDEDENILCVRNNK